MTHRSRFGLVATCDRVIGDLSDLTRTGAKGIGMGIHRRKFLTSIAAAGAASLGFSAAASGGADAWTEAHESGELLLFGYEGRLDSPRIDFQERSSVLTRVRLKDGAVESVKLPMEKAHIAMPLGQGRVLCCPQNGPHALVVDRENRIVQRFEAPKGFFYSGHGLLLNDRSVLLVPLCKTSRSSVADRGAVEVYDAKDLRLLRRIEDWGINPHEIQYLPSRNELVVADYGTLTTAGRPVLTTFGQSCIFTCDPDTLAVKKVYDQTDLNGAVTHVRVTDDGQAYVILQQSVFMDTARGERTFAAAVLDADRVAESEFSLPPRDYALPFIQYKTPEMSVPRPLVKVNLASGQRQQLLVHPRFHIRPQSVERNVLTGTVLASYTGSDCLVAQRGGESPYIIDGADIGLTEVRGLADIPGTPFVGIAGSERNVSIVDVRTGVSVTRIRSDNFVAPHMTFARSD